MHCCQENPSRPLAFILTVISIPYLASTGPPLFHKNITSCERVSETPAKSVRSCLGVPVPITSVTLQQENLYVASGEQDKGPLQLTPNNPVQFSYTLFLIIHNVELPLSIQPPRSVALAKLNEHYTEVKPEADKWLKSYSHRGPFDLCNFCR